MKLATKAFYLERYLDLLDQYNLLPSNTVRRFSERRSLRAFAKTIKPGKNPQIAGYRFSPIKVRTLTGRRFDWLLAVDGKMRCTKRLTVFVGHRFVDNVTRNFRHNLQRAVQPYGVRLVYSDSDMPNAPIFQTILDRIGKSKFCVFDDRETEVRPNVFIELGAAIALKRPYFYFSFVGKRRVKIKGMEQKVEIPSDLDGMLRMPYETYEDLFTEFAVRLPGFLVDRKLAVRKGTPSVLRMRPAPLRARRRMLST